MLLKGIWDMKLGYSSSYLQLHMWAKAILSWCMHYPTLADPPLAQLNLGAEMQSSRIASQSQKLF